MRKINNENGLNFNFISNTYKLGNPNPFVVGNNKSVLTFEQNLFKFTTKNSTQFMFVENGQWGIGDTNGSSNSYALQSDGSGLFYTTANSSNVGFYMNNDQYIRFGSDNNGTYIEVNDNTQIIETNINGNKLSNLAYGFTIDFNNLYTTLGFESENQYIKLDTNNNSQTTFGTNNLLLDDSGSGDLILNDSSVVQSNPFRSLKITIDNVDYIIPLWSTR